MSSIRIVHDRISHQELETIAQERFGDMVKVVVDVERRIMAIGGEMHADEEQILLDDGSQQKDLWGINLYPHETGERFIEYDSMINIRPSQGNRSRNVENEMMRNKIKEVVDAVIY